MLIDVDCGTNFVELIIEQKNASHSVSSGGQCLQWRYG